MKKPPVFQESPVYASRQPTGLAGHNPYMPPGSGYPYPAGRKKSAAGRIVARILIALLGLSVGFGAYTWYLLGKPLFTEIPIIRPHDGTAVPIDHYTIPDAQPGGAWGQGGRVRVYVHPDFPIEQVERVDKKVENILIFGVDARSPEEMICRADSLIVLTVDTREKCVKLTSIMRDTEVDLAGRTSNEKINAAYALGGVGLLINTINQNFGLDIQAFAMFDFYSATELIDIVGGMEIDVQAEEVENLNEILNEMHALFHSQDPVPHVQQAGPQKLNGMQTIAWARIRKVGSDHARTGRQRQVMMNLIAQFKGAALPKKISFLDESLGHFETNLGRSDLMRIGLDAMQSLAEMREYKVPADGMYQTDPGNWNMRLDWAQQLPALHTFIWGAAGK